MREIPDPGFAGDDGSTSPELASVLAAYRDDASRFLPALSVLTSHRLLVPVMAVLGEAERGPDGLEREKSSDMATVLMRGRDGRLALLAFSGSETMSRWDPSARPVPVTARTAALAAVQEGADALVVDLAGPVRLVVEGDHLRSLAEGQRLMRVGSGYAWVRDAEAGRTGPV